MKEKTDVIILNKPVGYTTLEALELLEEQKTTHSYSISELDSNSEGLLVFVTNNHPTEAEMYENEYEITIDDYLSKPAENILTKGMNNIKKAGLVKMITSSPSFICFRARLNKDILEDNPEISEEEVLNYFKDTFFNDYEIVDNLDLNFKVSIV